MGVAIVCGVCARSRRRVYKNVSRDVKEGTHAAS